MRIGLVDIDGHHFPNLALMKLSAWHKSQGDSVEFANPMFGCYDRVYMSKVFTFTPDCSDIYHCEVIRGGTGFRRHIIARRRYLDVCLFGHWFELFKHIRKCRGCELPF